MYIPGVIRDRIVRSPEGAGAGAGTETVAGGDGNDTVEDDDSPLAMMRQLLSEDPKPEPKPDPAAKPAKTEEEEDAELQQTEAENLSKMIKTFSIPENMVPENFDPSDPKQFRTVMASMMQRAILTSLQAFARPLALSNEALMKSIRKEMSESITNSISTNQGKNTLMEIVPEINEKGYDWVQSLYDSSIAKGKKPLVAAQNIRKIIDGMSVGEDGKPNPKRTDPSHQGSKSFAEGKNALDRFMPMPAK